MRLSVGDALFDLHSFERSNLFEDRSRGMPCKMELN